MTSRSPLLLLTVARLKLFFREPSAVFWSFGFPILLSIALGIAFRDKPPEPIAAAVQAGPGAERVVASLEASGQVKARPLEADAAKSALRTGKVAIVVRPGATRTYAFDPTRPESRLARTVVDDLLQRADGRVDPTPVAEAKLTEPGSRYIDFLLPGLIGLNIMSSGMWGIGYVIVEDRTRKLLKRMLAMPMKRSHFLLSFVFMRVLFLAIELPVLMLFGWLAFSITIRGSLLLLGLIALLGAFAFAGLGLLVASRARNTQTVGGLMNLVMMPMYVLSGVFFSSANFPEPMKPFIKALPLTALNDGMRAVINEGAGFAAVAPQAGILAATALVTFVAAVKLFRWS